MTEIESASIGHRTSDALEGTGECELKQFYAEFSLDCRILKDYNDFRQLFRMSKTLKRIYRQFVFQENQWDSGLACLLSVIRYYEGDADGAFLKRITKTSLIGTTLAGINEGAQSLGLDVEIFELESIKSLANVRTPAILCTTLEFPLYEYVVFYGIEKGQYIIGDPRKGVVLYDEVTLKELWNSRILLEVSCNDNFVSRKKAFNYQKKVLLDILKKDRRLLKFIISISILSGGVILLINEKVSLLIFSLSQHKDFSKSITCLIALTIFCVVQKWLTYLFERFHNRKQREFVLRCKDYYLDYLLSCSATETKIGKEYLEHNEPINAIILAFNQLVKVTIASVPLILLPLISVFINNYQLGTINLLFIIIGLVTLHFVKEQPFGNLSLKYTLRDNSPWEILLKFSTIKTHVKESFFTNIITIQHREEAQNEYQDKKRKIIYIFFLTIQNIIFSATIAYILIKPLNMGNLDFQETIYLSGLEILLLYNLSKLGSAVVDFKMAIKMLLRIPPDTINKVNFVLEHLGKLCFQYLKISNLNVTFYNGTTLKDLSLLVRRGRAISIIGSADSGINSIVSILEKNSLPEMTEISIGVNDIEYPWNAISKKGWYKIFTRISVNVDVFNGTLIENISLGNLHEEYYKVINFCKENRFEDFINKFPQGYLTIIGDNGLSLSSEQLIILSLARALYKQSKFLVIDGVMLLEQTEDFFLFYNALSIEKSELSLLFINSPFFDDIIDETFYLKAGELRII